MKSYRYILLTLLVLVSLQSAKATDNAPAAKDTVVLQRVPVPGTSRQLAMGIAEFPPNASKPRHKAAGPEVAYVLEGEVTVQIDGQPTRVVHAGESYRMPANVVHVTTAGPAGAKVIASWAWIPGTRFNTLVPN
ncbi:cupin domain-containing protein [Paraburkholderia phenazinium]|jgi:quercetin dioxygenase-like cupin family protein|uniref:Cupin domain-containing protein n=1 Tax=Paraburkholderia phenazinium TaxID=60549 RepID=A0A1G7TQ59_9BURK|nr:cupin domain-containing protein [Paraburkholderia phenazinium]SDG36779.1 Cupin domain-containing protein [Paraburkholderia phenazinium]